jgi:transposase
MWVAIWFNCPVGLTEDQRAELVAYAKSRDVYPEVALRARMILWEDEGLSIGKIALRAGVSRPTLNKWRKRYREHGIAGLAHRDRPGGRRRIPPQVRSRILALTRTSPPQELGISHWSSREMAAALKAAHGIEVSHNFISELWREHDLKPHIQGTFKLSKDPAFAEKVADIVGLYLDPPQGAVVLSVDEKTQVQALDRTQPLLPISFGTTEKRTHDYVRHGTTNLFAALEVASGKVTGRCFPRRRTKEFIAFMENIARRYEGRELHVVLDNLSTHHNKTVELWLAKNQNVTLHFTPTGSSWMNQVETWFGIITQQAIRRGTFGSVKILIQTIERYITNWNTDCEPFTWTATEGEILAKVKFIESEVRRMLDCNAK